MTYKKLQSRIDKGVEWLNKNKPGWFRDIDLDRLDLGDADVCILGQAFNDFWGKVHTISNPQKDKMDFMKAVDLGFVLDDGRYEAPYYDYLTHLWYTKILELRGRLTTD